MEQENKPKAQPVKFPGIVRGILPLFLSTWLIPISLVAIVFAIILPMFQKSEVYYKYDVYRSNLKQIALSVLMYKNDNSNGNLSIALALPTPEKWNDLTFEYLGSEDPYLCPSVKQQPSKTCPYVLNRNLYDMKGSIPGDIVLLFEGPVGWNQSGGPEMLNFRHNDHNNDAVCNVAFADGTIRTVKKSEAGKLKWEVVSAD